MQRFIGVRIEDVSGISGCGEVFSGCIMPSGKAVLEWKGPLSSVCVYDSIEAVIKIHGHDSKTLVEFIDAVEEF